MSESWIDRYERAGLLGRVGMLGSGAVRLLAGAIDKGLEHTASVLVESKEAVERELDPNVSEARILDEWDDDPGTPSSPAESAD